MPIFTAPPAISGWNTISNEQNLGRPSKKTQNRVVREFDVHKIMERKYEAFIYEQCESFADSWVAEEMAVLTRIHLMTNEIASTLYRLVKHPGMAQHYIEQLYETHAAHLEKRPQRAQEPLAPLPAGTMMPLEFLFTKKEV